MSEAPKRSPIPSSLRKANPIEEAQDLAKEILAELGASSCTFYLRDPFWQNEFRLLCMPGVKIRPPMFGFLHPIDARRILASGMEEEFVTDVRSSTTLFANHGAVNFKGDEERKRLFGNFVEREGVISCARLQSGSKSGQPTAMLFVNYECLHEFSEAEEAQLRAYMRMFSALVPGIYGDIRDHGSRLAVLPTILEPIRTLSSLGLEREPSHVEQCMIDILTAALEAFGIDPEQGCGTAHLLNRKTGKLSLFAAAPANPGVKSEQLVHDGEGIISWVVHRKRAILIDNIRTSPYARIYVPGRSSFMSEMAVPLLVGDEVLGVLNLESSRPGAFQDDDVRLFWYAATEAAIAIRMNNLISQEKLFIRNTSALLHMCYDASLHPGATEAQLDALADVVRSSMRADACDLWIINAESSEYETRGLSSPSGAATPRPRKNGWSRYVSLTNTPVYLAAIAPDGLCTPAFWDKVSAQWTRKPARVKCPKRVNGRKSSGRTGCALGVPIPLRDAIIGVAWCHYYDPGTMPPDRDGVELITGLAAHVGLVLDCLQRHKDMEVAKVQQVVEKKIQQTFFPSGHVAANLNGLLEGYVLAKPCDAELGGDFYGAWSIDNETCGFLLGDAKGHGKEAALSMLPMYATCRAVYKDSRSTERLIERLSEVSRSLKLHGSAAYLVLRKVGHRVYALASAAGHHPFVLARHAETRVEPIPTSGGSANIILLGTDHEMSILQDHVELQPGDTIVGYSDGVSEAGAPDNEFGDAGVSGVVMANRSQGRIEDIAVAVYEKAREHAAGHLRDDCTIIVLRLRKEGRGAATPPVVAHNGRK